MTDDTARLRWGIHPGTAPTRVLKADLKLEGRRRHSSAITVRTAVTALPEMDARERAQRLDGLT
jgi:hypothetical protein